MVVKVTAKLCWLPLLFKSKAAAAAANSFCQPLLLQHIRPGTARLFNTATIYREYKRGFEFGSEMAAKFHPLVFSGPSGTGKSTLVQRLMKEYPGCFAFSVSHTTRNPREGESHGKDYYFVSREEMQRAIDNHEFVEYAEFSGNMYGTSKKAITDISGSGRICILDIDMQGVKSIKLTDLECRYIFVKPPSIKHLEDRLRKRGSETDDSLQKRLSVAKAELDYAETPGVYHFILVNDDLDKAYVELKNFLKKDITEVTKCKPQSA